MSQPIARSSDEIRAVLGALAGEHLPTRNAYFGAAVWAVLCGIIWPVILIWVMYEWGSIQRYEWWESLFYSVAGPILAFQLVRVAMSRYVVDDDHIACIAPLGLGSWTMMRAEIERIEVNVGPRNMALVLHSGLQKPKTMPLRKRLRDQLLRNYPELRSIKARASAEERAKKKWSKVALVFICLTFAAFLVVFALAIYFR